MKKFILVLSLTLLAVFAFGVGAVFAQGGQPPVSPGQGSGSLQAYMTQAMADSLDLSVEDFNARRAAGETYYSIALAQGIPAEDIPALMQAVRASAIEAALADGVLTQAQADWMNSRGLGRSGMGYNGDCPMNPGRQASPGSNSRW